MLPNPPIAPTAATALFRALSEALPPLRRRDTEQAFRPARRRYPNVAQDLLRRNARTMNRKQHPDAAPFRWAGAFLRTRCRRVGAIHWRPPSTRARSTGETRRDPRTRGRPRDRRLRRILAQEP